MMAPSATPTNTNERAQRKFSLCLVGSRWGVTGPITQFLLVHTPGNGLTDLGTLGGGESKGYGINASGQVTGEVPSGAFLYTPGSGMTDLGTLGGGSSTGYAINASGQVTGQEVTANGALPAFLYTPDSG